jgi:hypothetical protein
MPERQPREKDDVYLAWLRTQPCCICGDNTSTEAAHLRIGSVNDGKRETGMGEKPSDKWALPLCSRHHRMQHSMREDTFWQIHGLDPVALCMRYRHDR